MKRPQINKYKYNQKQNTVTINDKFEIDFTTGTIYWDSEYTGRRSEFLPNYIFLIRDAIQMTHRILRALGKSRITAETVRHGVLLGTTEKAAHPHRKNSEIIDEVMQYLKDQKEI